MTNEIKWFILSRLTKKYILRGVAQLVARHIWDVDAAGSTPVTPTKIAVSTFVETAIFFVFDSKESSLSRPPPKHIGLKTIAFFFASGIIFLCSITIMKEVEIW